MFSRIVTSRFLGSSFSAATAATATATAATKAKSCRGVCSWSTTSFRVLSTTKPTEPQAKSTQTSKGAPAMSDEDKEKEKANIASLGHPPADHLPPLHKETRLTWDDGNDLPIPDVNQRFGGKPDALSFLRKIGVAIPGENTIVEYDFWKMIFSNRELKGVGFHFSAFHATLKNIQPTDEFAEFYSKPNEDMFAALDHIVEGQPEYLIFACSLEPFMRNIRSTLNFKRAIEERYKLHLCSSTEAFPKALHQFGAKKIGILTPYGPAADDNCVAFFKEAGFEVVAIKGLRIPDPISITHILPDTLREAVRELNVEGVDAIIQSGTAMSFVEVAEEMEQEIGKPIIPINVVLLWYALRQLGVRDKLYGSTRLLREF